MRDHIIALILAIVTVAAIELVAFNKSARAADSTITIDQIGSYNTTQVTQDGAGHAVNIKTGLDSDVDNTYIAITQHSTGAKNASVDIRSGINNGVTINQDGAGNHNAAIQNLAGNANNITVGQAGSGNHSMTITATLGTTNSGNTITTEQSGSADKTFNLTLGGTNAATVNVQQTNPTTANTGAMSIQCNPCGVYSYTRQ
jgi:hypothetical protein